MEITNYNRTTDGSVLLEFADKVRYLMLVELREALESKFGVAARLTISHDLPTISLRTMDDTPLPEDENPEIFVAFARGWFYAMRRRQ